MAATRCFAAIQLPDEVRAGLVRAAQTIVDIDPAWRGEKWVAERNLHVTLKFFGNLSDGDVEAVAREAADGLHGLGAFRIACVGLQAVPSPRRCQMVWARFDDPSGSAADAARTLDRVGEGVGVPPDDRRFKPHVTLARSRSSKPLISEALAIAQAPLVGSGHIVSVPSVTFFASKPTRHGPEYETIAEWPL